MYRSEADPEGAADHSEEGIQAQESIQGEVLSEKYWITLEQP